MGIEVPFIILILAIPIYFISRWILNKNNIGNEKNRKYFAILPAIFLSPFVYVGIMLIWFFSISYYPESKFDKKEWDTNVEERYEMSEDIIESELLIGKTKNEVVKLLGSDYSDYITEISYELGYVPELFNIDPDYLDIYFNDKGIVVQVIQHGS